MFEKQGGNYSLVWGLTVEFEEEKLLKHKCVLCRTTEEQICFVVQKNDILGVLVNVGSQGGTREAKSAKRSNFKQSSPFWMSF